MPKRIDPFIHQSPILQSSNLPAGRLHGLREAEEFYQGTRVEEAREVSQMVGLLFFAIIGGQLDKMREE